MPAQFRQPTQNTTYIAGTSTYSGQPNTTQVRYTQGGQVNAAGVYSGTGAVQIALGQGRLDTAQMLAAGLAAPAAASGQPVIFFDSHAAGSYSSTSGHRILAVLDAKSTAQLGFGPTGYYNSGAVMIGSLPVQLGVPYNSGLCVQALSGAPGYACSYTPSLSGQG